MNINEKILNALSNIVDGNIWALSKPPDDELDVSPDTYIVFNPELEVAEDFGDDEDLEWNQYMQVHWYSRGRVDYLDARKRIRKALKEAGLSVTETTAGYDSDSGKTASGNNTGWTHLVILCNDVEEDLYGNDS